MEVAQEPYGAVLYEWDAGNEDEEIRGILRMGEDIARARMLATAFHEPKKLDRFDRAMRERAARLNQTPVEDALARAQKMAEDVARAERIARRRARKG